MICIITCSDCYDIIKCISARSSCIIISRNDVSSIEMFFVTIACSDNNQSWEILDGLIERFIKGSSTSIFCSSSTSIDDLSSIGPSETKCLDYINSIQIISTSRSQSHNLSSWIDTHYSCSVKSFCSDSTSDMRAMGIGASGRRIEIHTKKIKSKYTIS